MEPHNRKTNNGRGAGDEPLITLRKVGKSTESVAIGVFGWALATLAAWTTSKAVGALLAKLMFNVGLDYTFEPSGPLVWLGVSICLGTVASFLPAWHASRRPVREAIGYE